MNPDILIFRAEIRSLFPDSAQKADALMKGLGWEEEELNEIFSIWLNAFADITNELMVENSTEEVLRHFEYFSRCFEEGSSEVKKLIDVDYVENLFWKIPEEISSVYWELLPQNLQTLYINFHHCPPTSQKQAGTQQKGQNR